MNTNTKRRKAILPKDRIHVRQPFWRSLIPILKGTANGEEALYMLGMTYYNQGDFVTASHYFNTYYTTYPRGTYTELARFHSGKALYLDTRNHVWTRAARTRLFRNCRCFWSIFRKSAKGYCPKHDF